MWSSLKVWTLPILSSSIIFGHLLVQGNVKQEGEDEKDGGGEEDEEEEEDGEKKKKTGKSYDYATKLNYLFREARYPGVATA